MRRREGGGAYRDVEGKNLNDARVGHTKLGEELRRSSQKFCTVSQDTKKKRDGEIETRGNKCGARVKKILRRGEA